MTWTINKILLVISIVFFAVALVITAGWVDAAGNARDSWLVAGLLLLAASFLP